MHELIVAATQQNWPIIKAHIERMGTIFEAIIREGAEPPRRNAGFRYGSHRLSEVFDFDGDPEDQRRVGEGACAARRPGLLA
jgi:hypothetical protein